MNKFYLVKKKSESYFYDYWYIVRIIDKHIVTLYDYPKATFNHISFPSLQLMFTSKDVANSVLNKLNK